MRRSRLNVFLEPDHSKRLEELAVLRGISKSSIVAAAVSDFLGSDGASQQTTMAAKRLDRLSRQFDRLERDQYILIETVALYIRYYLTVTSPLPEGQQEAARAHGRIRFNEFVHQLAQHLQRGRSLVGKLQPDAFPGKGTTGLADGRLEGGDE